jgi:hypothetical protein
MTDSPLVSIINPVFNGIRYPDFYHAVRGRH